MPATSQAQQRLFAIALHRPSSLRTANKSLASLPDSTLKEFASTPRTGLPKKVKIKKASLAGLMKRKPKVDNIPGENYG